MNVVDCVQGSPEWLAARCGYVTASRMSDVLATRKDKQEAADRETYRIELLTEILTGKAVDHYVSKDMELGREFEGEAHIAYERATGNMVEQVGFVLHPTIEGFGASPDGLVGRHGGLEIKVPRSTTHMRWLLAGVVPAAHQPQMFSGLECCERDWWDFISYNPTFPKEMRSFICRLDRNGDVIAGINAAAVQFLCEVNEMVDRLRNKYGMRMPELPKPAPQDMGGMGLTNEELDYIIKL